MSRTASPAPLTLAVIWRIQKRGILAGTDIRVIVHSRWRRVFGVCRCIGCCLRRIG